MNQAIKLNPFDSPKYVYMNVGLFREGPHFCGKTVVRHPEVILEDRIVLYPYRALSVEWKDVDRDSDPIWSQGFWSHYTTGGFISGGVDAWPRFLDKIEESIQLYDEKGVVGLHDDQVVMQSTCMRNPGSCYVVRWDSPFGYGNGCFRDVGDPTTGYALHTCLENGGRTSESGMNNFFSSKFRLWHDGDADTMYWDPALGTPTEDEDPGLYHIPVEIKEA